MFTCEGSGLAPTQRPGGRSMGLRGSAALTLVSTQHSAELRKRRPSSTFPDCGPDSRSLRLRSDSAHEVTPPLDGPAHWVQGGCQPPGWLLGSEPRGRAGRGLRGAELVARRAAPRPLGKWMLRSSADAKGRGKRSFSCALAPPRTRQEGGAASVLPRWRWAEPGAEKRSRL